MSLKINTPKKTKDSNFSFMGMFLKNESIVQTNMCVCLYMSTIEWAITHGEIDAHSFALNNWKARSLFRSWVLSSVQKMRIPVGLWTRSTAVSTLLTFWPARCSSTRNDLMKIFHSFYFHFSFFLQKMKHGKENHSMKTNIHNFCRIVPPAPPDLAVVSSISFGSITTSTSSA